MRPAKNYYKNIPKRCTGTCGVHQPARKMRVKFSRFTHRGERMLIYRTYAGTLPIQAHRPVWCFKHLPGGVELARNQRSERNSKHRNLSFTRECVFFNAGEGPAFSMLKTTLMHLDLRLVCRSLSRLSSTRRKELFCFSHYQQ